VYIRAPVAERAPAEQLLIKSTSRHLRCSGAKDGACTWQRHEHRHEESRRSRWKFGEEGSAIRVSHSGSAQAPRLALGLPETPPAKMASGSGDEGAIVMNTDDLASLFHGSTTNPIGDTDGEGNAASGILAEAPSGPLYNDKQHAYGVPSQVSPTESRSSDELGGTWGRKAGAKVSDEPSASPISISPSLCRATNFSVG